jgi:HEAT repeat protein
MLKQKILDLLKSPDFNQQLNSLKDFPFPKILNHLFAALCSEDEEIKWHAVTATGFLVADRAERNLEEARNILRRMMWSLNEESGGIGWGLPEAMGEILARNEGLAREFAPLLVSYLQPGGNFLDFEPLLQGALWAVARLAESHPQILQSLDAHSCLLAFLSSPDASARGYAILALGQIGKKESLQALEAFLQDETEIPLYENQEFRRVRISQLARKALQAVPKL